jgi:hypothetical protein
MANIPSGKVTEIIVYLDGHPVYSGSKLGAQIALQAGYAKNAAEGRAEPAVKLIQRVVDYDLSDKDDNKVIETEITL